MVIELLKKIANSFEKKRNSIFKYPVEKQKKYVEHFKEPKDGIERSYFQYCCQMKLYGKLFNILLNIAALPLVIFYILRLKETNLVGDRSDVVFFNDGKPFNIIPNSLLKKYKKILTLSSDKRSFNKNDKKYLYKIFKKYPFSWLFWLKLIIKISQYSYAIEKHSPKAIICCSEFSFTSSILTEYCHLRNVKLINIMHGEKLYSIVDSFVKFDEFYVWSQDHLDLLISLRADKKQFKIELAESLKTNYKTDTEKKYDYIYYLGSETKKELVKIKNSLDILKQKGFNVAVRPHPRYSSISNVRKVFCSIDIENPRDITIEESLNQTKNAIALFSTVLTQAYYGKINIVIDDVSSIKRYNKLEELNYTMFKAKHKLLSSLIEKK